LVGFMDNWGMGQSRNPWDTPPYYPVGGSSSLGGMSSWGMGTPTTVALPSSVSAVAGSAGGVTGAAGAVPRVAPELGLNMDTANLALTGLSTIGNLWAAFQAQKLAKEQFKYTKGVTETNLANQMKTYNTALTDRANNRAIVEGRDSAYTKSYIDENSLRRYGM